MLTYERHSEDDLKTACNFCGENNADALWQGATGEIFVCSLCAREYLPQLMADAIVGGTSLRHLQNAKGPTVDQTKENEILLRYRGAYNSALLRKLRVSDRLIENEPDLRAEQPIKKEQSDW